MPLSDDFLSLFLSLSLFPPFRSPSWPPFLALSLPPPHKGTFVQEAGGVTAGKLELISRAVTAYKVAVRICESAFGASHRETARVLFQVR